MSVANQIGCRYALRIVVPGFGVISTR